MSHEFDEGIERSPEISPHINTIVSLLVDDELINQETLCGYLLKGKLPPSLTGLIEQLPQGDRENIAQRLLQKALPGIRATVDGEDFTTEDDNLFLLACRIGTVSDADRAVYIDKFMKLAQVESREPLNGQTLDNAVMELVQRKVIASEQGPAILARYQISELELPEADEEAEGDEEDEEEDAM